jgi:hypothetical protein
VTIAALITEGIGPGGSVKYLLTEGLDIGTAVNLPGPILVSSGFNISDATSLVIKITRPDGSILTVSGTVGTKNAYTWVGLFEAGTYATYQPVEGDINLLGGYQIDLTYFGPTINLQPLLHSNFTVVDLSTFATSPSSGALGLVSARNIVWF